MKIVHCFNIAGVATTLSKELRKIGHETIIIDRKGRNENMGFNLDIQSVYKRSPRGIYWEVLKQSRNADILHIHYSQDVLSKTKILKKINRKVKVIMHFHGSDIRGKWDEFKGGVADKVIVATPDLLEGAPEFVHYLPNPVDTEHWSREKDPFPNSGVYVNANKKYDKNGFAWANKKAEEYGIKPMHRLDRIYPYKIYPRIMEYYDHYFDIKYDQNGEIIAARSLNALQFLALGRNKVISEQGIMTTLPKKHWAENVVDKLMKIYEY